MPAKTILHLTGMRSSKYGGIEAYLREIARLCGERGYKTVLQYESAPVSREYVEDLRNLNVETAVCSLRGNPVRAILRATSLLRRYRPAVVHAHFPKAHVLLALPFLTSLFGGGKTIAMVHGNPNFGKNSWRSVRYRWFDRVLAVSRAGAENLVQAGVPARIVSTHYMGLFGARDPSQELRRRFRDELGIPQDAVVLGCIAFDSPLKGVDVLLQTFARIQSRYPKLRLMEIGVDPAQSALPAQAERLGLSGRVHWVGIRDEGWRWLNAADVYVQPSRSEGLPFAVMEAMALGLPVVATRVAGAEEALGETGFLAEPCSAESLAETLDRVLSAPGRWAELGAVGRARFREFFSGEKSVSLLVEKYYALAPEVRGDHFGPVSRALF